MADLVFEATSMLSMYEPGFIVIGVGLVVVRISRELVDQTRLDHTTVESWAAICSSIRPLIDETSRLFLPVVVLSAV